jgi:phage tail-like protein
MSVAPRVHLPDLTGPKPAPSPSGWMSLASLAQLNVQTQAPLVEVPTLEDARRCAARAEPGGGCTPTVVSFDPPDGTTLVQLGGGGSLDVHVRVTPGVLDGVTPLLTLHAIDLPSGVTLADVQIRGRVEGACRDRIVFAGAVTTAATPFQLVPPATAPAQVTYVLSVAYQTVSASTFNCCDAQPGAIIPCAGPTAELTVALNGAAEGLPIDPCALTLAPCRAPVGVALLTPPSAWPSPPLLAVDPDGCLVAAWSVNRHGWALVPWAGGVDLRQSCRGGVRARIHEQARVDAIFWGDTIAVLTPTAVTLYDLDGCPLAPSVFAITLLAAVALGISDEGFLIVIDSALTAPNVHYLRRDGSLVQAPAAFDARGWYARHRSPAFVISSTDGSYSIQPALAATATPACYVTAARPLTDAEALLFERIDDLPDLRERFAYPASGQVVLGAEQLGDLLDAGRVGVQWHRVLLFGQIPAGCAVGIETLTFDDPLIGQMLLAGDTQSSTQGWSTMVVVDAASAGPVAAPGDLRTAAGDALVLAGPGRFLWIRLTLQSDGRATPRITAIELEQPRLGTALYLPKVFRDSTPQDDFLRRWLSLFEEAGWNGLASRMDRYAQIFDPRTAPEAMLPYLAGWLEIPLFPNLVADPVRLRRVLVHANDLALGRGTIDGLVLAADLYLDVTLQVVESCATRSRFVLGVGQTLLGETGPILGADTVLTMERSPTTLGDEPALGDSYLLETDDRDGTIAYHFDVLVPARQVCSAEILSLLTSLIETEKPAYTTYTLRLVAPAGWVVGVASVVGQEVGPGFDRRTLDPTTYGLALLNGPTRPKPVGFGFTLGYDSRLTAPAGDPLFQLDATLGRTTRLGA